MIFGTFENLGNFGIHSNFFQQKASLPTFNVVEYEFISIETLFHPRSTLKLGERGKFLKCAKGPIYFVQGCSFINSTNVLSEKLNNPNSYSRKPELRYTQSHKLSRNS